MIYDLRFRTDGLHPSNHWRQYMSSQTTVRTKMSCIGFETYQWFVDEVGSLSARADARLIMEKARSIRQYLKDLGWPETDLPIIDKHWIGRWRREFGVVYRAVTTRFKVSFDAACRRVQNMLCNIFRLQALWELCHPGIPMRWFSMEQKPSWFNNAGLKKTFTKKGTKNVTVKENFHATRARYTINVCLTLTFVYVCLYDKLLIGVHWDVSVFSLGLSAVCFLVFMSCLLHILFIVRLCHF